MTSEVYNSGGDLSSSQELSSSKLNEVYYNNPNKHKVWGCDEGFSNPATIVADDTASPSMIKGQNNFDLNNQQHDQDEFGESHFRNIPIYAKNNKQRYTDADIQKLKLMARRQQMGFVN